VIRKRVKRVKKKVKSEIEDFGLEVNQYQIDDLENLSVEILTCMVD